jgi:hypothetical protein
MKKGDKHELYCGCERCKPTSRALIILTPAEIEKAMTLIKTTEPTTCEGKLTDGSMRQQMLDIPGWTEIEAGGD